MCRITFTFAYLGHFMEESHVSALLTSCLYELYSNPPSTFSAAEFLCPDFLCNFWHPRSRRRKCHRESPSVYNNVSDVRNASLSVLGHSVLRSGTER